MNRLSLIATASVLAVLGGATSASAQATNIGVSLRAGIVFPTSSDTSNAYGTNWFGFGAEYTLYKIPSVPGLKPSISLSADYFSRNGLNETPVLVNFVVHSSSFFADAGVGGSFDHFPGSTETNFGYQIGIGYDLPIPGIPVFLEAKFWGNQDSSLDAVGLYAGVRF